MIKLIIKSAIILLFSLGSVLAEKINKIEISGNKRISKETIQVLGQIAKGEEFDKFKLNDVLKKLYETNFFNDIQISAENGVLSISLKENPIIEDLEITGIKNKTFKKKITESIILKNRISFTENHLKRDLITINNI